MSPTVFALAPYLRLRAQQGWRATRWLAKTAVALTIALVMASQAWGQCGPLPTNWPVTAGSSALNIGSGTSVNGVIVSGSTGNSITMAGSRTSSVPASFPALLDVGTSSSTIRLSNLSIGSNGSYTFSPGNYLINGANIGGGSTITVQAGARLYLQGSITLGSSVSFNKAGPTEMGQVFLYPNANLNIGSNSSIRGVIYSPGNGNNINIGSGTSVTGAIIVNGSVGLNGASVTLTGTDQAALAGISTCADSTPPAIASASLSCGSSTQATITFSEQVRQAAAETTSNYTIPLVSVTGARLEADYRTVTLTLGSAVTSTKTLTVSNVADLAGNTILAASTATLSPAPLYAGLLGAYYDQNGHRDALGTYAFTGTRANRVDSQLNFNWGTNAPGVGSTPADGFSVRWTGVIKTKAAGSYGFATGSDDGVRLTVNNGLLIDNFSDHSYTVNSAATRPTLAGSSYVPITMEFYDNTADAIAQLGWQEPGQSGSTYYIIPAANLFNCTSSASQLNGFSVTPSSLSASTCAGQTITITALDTDGTAYEGFTGTISLSTSSGHGSWTLGNTPAPSGTLVDNGNGSASYTFVAADAGVVKLVLSHTLAQDVSVTVSSGGYTATSGAIQFRDNAFVFAEDTGNKVSGSDVAVVGRPHDFSLSVVRKNASTGGCGVATDYTGNHSLKFWRTDSGGSHTAPNVVSPALSVPGSQPTANNLTLSFTAGVASFNLATSDQGRYAINVRDDSLSSAATVITGGSNTLTVRPFALLVNGLQYGSTANPGGAAASDAVFAPAGANFSTTVGAYAWSSAMLTNGADPGNTGSPSSTATASALTAGGRVPSFASTVSLGPASGSQTPSTGVLGSLNNGTVVATAFSNGSATVSNLQYTEVGSFNLATTGVVSNYLGSGLALDGLVTLANGTQSTRVGRFVPAGFALSNGSVTHRSAASCSPSSTFSYLGEPFTLGFTLTAQNALGATTTNYTGSFAKLNLSSASAFNLAGIDGATPFTTNGSPARLSLGSSSGSWSQGVASGVTLAATAERGSSADGPFSASFGIAPVDSDGVALRTLDLDTSVPADGADHGTVASVALRLGRLKLANAIGAQQRALSLPLTAQYWNGSAWTDNTPDSCTQIPASVVSLGNLRKSLTSADARLASGSLTLSGGRATLVLSPPASGHVGTLDVALSLGSTATDASCLQPWTPPSSLAATAGGNLAHLRSSWCSSGMDKDPAARASFGLYRGADNLIDQREAY